MPAQTAESSRIRALPALLINQIAAGEVVERPASVVKELVDNAIDAQATRIDVELEAGGVELIRVVDNGTGIEATDLLLALAPHATSKISCAQDLDHIASMGFRGEALASIASVSRLTLRSRTRTAESATRIDAEADTITEPRPDAGPIGTSITVRNLFFNTPARRKFLRTTPTERSHCLEVVRSLAMAHPAIAFRAKTDGKLSIDLPPNQSPIDRAVEILGKELAGSLLEAHADELDDDRGVALFGLVGLPEIARPTTKSQRFYVNGRPIQDRAIQHALQEAYRGLIDPSRKPTAVLMFEMDPRAVDVNVHPAKREVRFRDGGLIHSVTLRAIRAALQQADLTPRVVSAPPMRAEFGAGATNASSFAQSLQRITPKAPGASFDYAGLRDAIQAERDVTPFVDDNPDVPAIPQPRPIDRVLQVHNSFLVTQDEQGVVIIDQHALHERVMFEKIMSRLNAGDLESQRLLAPAIVRATAPQLERLADLSPLLRRLGIEAEPIGPAEVAVHAFPSFFFEKNVDPGEFLGELLERAEAEGDASDPEAALHEIVDMMSCKAAVKAGDHMAPDELEELLELRDQVERSSNCPHGRPTSLRLTIEDLEKQFGRR